VATDTAFLVETAAGWHVVTFVWIDDARRTRITMPPSADGTRAVVEDAEPRIGTQLLYVLSMRDWVGQTIEIATTRIGPILTVQAHDDAALAGTAPTAGAPGIVPVRAFGTQPWRRGDGDGG